MNETTSSTKPAGGTRPAHDYVYYRVASVIEVKIKAGKDEKVIKLSNGRYKVGNTIIVRNDPPKRTGHHLVTTWRDESTGKVLGYTLREATEVVA